MSLINKGPSIRVFQTDNELIDYINKLSGNNYSLVSDALSWVTTQDNIYIQNREFDKVITDGLILYLDAGLVSSYPRNGNNWIDLSGNDNDGILVNSPGFSTNDVDSIEFDGLNDYVTTGTQLDPIAYGLFADGTSSWSVSSWFLPDTTDIGENVITGKSGDTGSASTYTVWYEGTTLKVRLRGGDVLDITTSLNSNWNEVTITWDGTTAKAYLNGIFVNNIQVGFANKQTNDFVIGATADGNTGHYKGYIVDTKVYNRALIDTEVYSNYLAYSNRFFEWILSTGFWNDAGVWDDSAVWID